MGASSPTSPGEGGRSGRQTSQRARCTQGPYTNIQQWDLAISGQQQPVSTAEREEPDGAALLQVEQGPLHRGQLPPNIHMHTFAAAVHLHDSHVTFQEVLLSGPGFVFPSPCNAFWIL